jgi:hypothetical protein
MLKCFSQRQSLRSVDTDYASDCKNEANQVYDFKNIFIFDFHNLAKLLSSLFCVSLDPFENGLGLIGISIVCEQRVALLALPYLLYQYLLL